MSQEGAIAFAFVPCRKLYAMFKCSACECAFKFDILETRDTPMGEALEATIKKAGWLIADPPESSDINLLVCKACQKKLAATAGMFEIVRRH